MLLVNYPAVRDREQKVRFVTRFQMERKKIKGVVFSDDRMEAWNPYEKLNQNV